MYKMICYIIVDLNEKLYKKRIFYYKRAFSKVTDNSL